MSKIIYKHAPLVEHVAPNKAYDRVAFLADKYPKLEEMYQTIMEHLKIPVGGGVEWVENKITGLYGAILAISNPTDFCGYDLTDENDLTRLKNNAYLKNYSYDYSYPIGDSHPPFGRGFEIIDNPITLPLTEAISKSDLADAIIKLVDKYYEISLAKEKELEASEEFQKSEISIKICESKDGYSSSIVSMYPIQYKYCKEDNSFKSWLIGHIEENKDLTSIITSDTWDIEINLNVYEGSSWTYKSYYYRDIYGAEPVIIDNSKKTKTYPLYIKALLSGDYRGSATISLEVRVKGMMEKVMVYKLANDTITFTDNSSKLSVGHIEPVITERYIKEF